MDKIKIANSRFSRDVMAAMLVYRTIAKRVLGIRYNYYTKLERHFAVAWRYGISLLMFNAISIAMNNRREIPYLRAPMYYSLYLTLIFRGLRGNESAFHKIHAITFVYARQASFQIQNGDCEITLYATGSSVGIGDRKIVWLLHRILQLNVACLLKELCPSIIILLLL